MLTPEQEAKLRAEAREAIARVRTRLKEHRKLECRYHLKVGTPRRETILKALGMPPEEPDTPDERTPHP